MTYILVSYLFRIVRTRPMHLTTFRVNICGYFIPTLINRVKYIISKFHETYIQLSYLFRIVRTRPMHLTTFRVNIYCFQYHESCIQVSYLFRVVRKRLMQLTTFRINIWVHFNPTLINRVKYIILYS